MGTLEEQSLPQEFSGSVPEPRAMDIIPSSLVASPTTPAVQLLLKYLEAEGIQYIFGIPGGPLMPLYEALHERQRIRHVLTKHEEGAAFMADGYARVRRGLGVCCMTTGPGATNAVTGVATSYADGVPVLILTAQVSTSALGRGAFQETSAHHMGLVDLFRPITKASVMLVRADKMGETIRHLIRVALTGRQGPVHLNIPADLARKLVTDETIHRTRSVSFTAYFDRDSVKKAAQLLVRSSRCAILAGHGVNISGASEELRRLSERLMIPVATTVKGKGCFPEDHTLSLGVFGFAGSPRAEACLLDGELDVLLTIGTGLGEMSTNGWDERLQPKESLMQIEIDPEKMGHTYPVDIPLIGDAKTVLSEILFQVNREAKWVDRVPSMDLVYGIREKHPWANNLSAYKSDDVPLKPQRLMKDLQEALPKDALVFVEIGNSMSWAFHYLKVIHPHSFFHCLGLAAMGYGTTACLGAKLAMPHRPVISIVGDASFLMNGNEVHTACEYNIPIVWIIQNNGGHGMIYHGECVQFQGRFHNSLFRQPVDYGKFAQSLGALSFRVERPGELGPVLAQALKTGQPCVIDVPIDPMEAPPIGSRFKALNRYFDGKP
jgi:acetolactate synthase-1/2/3 large subunit